jgi:hypothetical protein
MSNKDKLNLDTALRALDADRVAKNLPILSVLIVDDKIKNWPCPIFWESVYKYKLALPDESEQQTVDRLRKMAYDHAKAKVEAEAARKGDSHVGR